MLQQLQQLQLFLLPVLLFVILYFLGRIKPIGDMYAFLFRLIDKVLASVDTWLSPFQPDKKQSSKYAGLRAIILIIALILAVVALTAEAQNTLQALTALWGDESAGAMVLPNFFYRSSTAWLFISVCSLFGGCWLEETLQAVPDEAKIFNIGKENTSFRRFISFSFFLSLFATACFYALRPFFLDHPHSNITHLLQVLTFISLGLLVPLAGVIAVFILGLGLHAVLSVLLTLVSMAVSLGADVCKEIAMHFTKEETTKQLQTSEAAATSVAEISPAQQIHSIPSPASNNGDEKKPSGQKRSRSGGSPALLKGGKIGLALVAEAKALELLALGNGGLPSQFAPAGRVKLTSSLL